MKIQVQYLQPVLFKQKQRHEELFMFNGTITLPALPPVGTTLWEYRSDDPDTAVVEHVRLVPEDGDLKRLTYEIKIMSRVESISDWQDFETWFSEKIAWILGLGLRIDDWPDPDYDRVNMIDSIEQFSIICDQAWYEKVVSEIQTEP